MYAMKGAPAARSPNLSLFRLQGTISNAVRFAVEGTVARELVGERAGWPCSRLLGGHQRYAAFTLRSRGELVHPLAAQTYLGTSLN
jgi:hypothetical protein